MTSESSTRRRRTEDILSLYEVGARGGAPTIDLADTPGSRLLSASANEKLLRWMSAHYAHVSSITRICAGMIFASWALPAHIGRILTPIATIGSLPIIILSPLVMSTDLLRSLIRHHEFWFFIATNALNWMIAAVLFNDVRITGCFACFLLNVLTIMMDANFRTIVPAVRTGLAWVPAICCIVVVCVTKVVDIDPDRFNAGMPKNKIGFNLANSFINVNTTLVIFVVRLTYRRRRVFTKQFLNDRIIPCCSIRCDLVLRRMKTEDRGSVGRLNAFLSTTATEPREFMLRRPTFTLSSSDVLRSVHPDDANGVGGISRQPRVSGKSSTIQVMRVITPTIAFLDLRHTVFPALVPLRRLALWKAVVLYGTGLVGLVLSGFTMYFPATYTDTALFDDALGIANIARHDQLIIATASCVCTAIFFTQFLASCQRDLLRALRHNFDFCFTSLQFLIACVCLADMMHWDFRCLSLMSWVLWFHWVLLWDALLPEIRDRFRFKKIYGTPVLVGIQLGLAWIIYSLFFSTYNALEDRELTNVSWGSFQLGIRTSTFLVGRITTMLTWTLRLVWKAVMSEEDDLIFIRGQLEYHTPLDFFPPIQGQPDRKKHASRGALRRLLRPFRRRFTAIRPVNMNAQPATQSSSPAASLILEAVDTTASYSTGKTTPM